MKLQTPYTPAYFLSSLGAGGLAVSFFMYIMFMTKHSTPIPTYDSILIYFNTTNPNVDSIFFLPLITIACVGIIWFAIIHFNLLIKNLLLFSDFKKTKAFADMKKENTESSLMTIPLTLAMSMNVSFILGAVFVPKLWNYIEYIFPIALLIFFAIGIYALSIFLKYISRIIIEGNFKCESNNSFSQMISSFAFAMIGVGMAAPVAMSTNQHTIAIGLLGSLFFMTIAILFALINMTLGFRSILEKGISKEASPTLWIVIPIMTLLGISLVRQSHGLEHEFHINIEKGIYFILTSIILAIQIIFGLIGYYVMKGNNYFKDYINGKEKSFISYALICPGVALVVFGFFFLHLGFVKTGLLAKFSPFYFLLIFPLVYLQIKTIIVMNKLNKKLVK